MSYPSAWQVVCFLRQGLTMYHRLAWNFLLPRLPQTHDLPDSASQMLRLKACTTVFWLWVLTCLAANWRTTHTSKADHMFRKDILRP
jgi:hypothetical protein